MESETSEMDLKTTKITNRPAFTRHMYLVSLAIPKRHGTVTTVRLESFSYLNVFCLQFIKVI